MEEQLPVVTRPLTSLERDLLIEAIGNSVYLRKQAYKKITIPDTVEGLDDLKIRLGEIKAVEDLKTNVQNGFICITVPEAEVQETKELPINGSEKITDKKINVKTPEPIIK